MKQGHLMTLADELLIDQNEIDNFVLPDDSVHINPAEDYCESLIKQLNATENEGVCLPWRKTHDKITINPGQVTLWAGYNGHKKSMLTSHVAHHFVQKGQSVCIASLEMHPVITMKRMAFQGIGNTNPTDNAIRDFFGSLQSRLYLYDQQNNVPSDRILRMVGYCGNKLGLDHCFVDSLMKCGMSPDDYGAQKDFINSLCSIAKDTGMHIHLITHMRKPPKDVSHIPDKYEIAGGGDITNQVDNVFIVWTDIRKKEELEKPPQDQDAGIINNYCNILKCDKQRHGEHEPTYGLYFNNRSLRFEETQSRKVSLDS